jgi:hypothetical protein
MFGMTLRIDICSAVAGKVEIEGIAVKPAGESTAGSVPKATESTNIVYLIRVYEAR